MPYRPEIDGIRAIAVLSVIGFHAGFGFPSGGFLGVDVFFVISGYLITGIIDREIAENRFSIASFYQRRVRRILPALYLVLLCCLPFAWEWQFSAELREFGKSLASVAFFGSNIFFYKSIDYFSRSVAEYPLIHTWSLAVEEQFYILFPAVVLLCRTRKVALIPAIVVIGSASFLFAVAIVDRNATFGFYMLPTRAWEFCVGAAVALIPATTIKPSLKLRNGMATAGLALLIGSLFLLDRHVAAPGLWTLLPVTGTGLILLFGTSETLVGQALSMRLLVGLGLMSYSAYLWHQPIFAFVRVRTDFGSNIAIDLLLIALTLLLAYLSWRFIEQPFRRKTFLSRGKLFALAGIATVAVAGIGLGLETGKGFPGRWASNLLPLEAWTHESDARVTECVGSSAAFIDPAAACTYNAPNPASIALWGDSHSAAIAGDLASALDHTGTGLRQFSFLGCPPISGVRVPDLTHDLCPDYNNRVLDAIRNHTEISTIIMVARWPMYMDGSRFNNEEGGITGKNAEFAIPTSAGNASLTHAQRDTMIGALLREEIEALLEAGKRIVLIGPIPEVGWRVPDRMEREIFRHPGTDRDPVTTSLDVYRKRSATIDAELAQLPDNPNLIRIDPSKLFCDTTIKGRCLAEIDGKPLYVDDNHPSTVGAAVLSAEIISDMQKRGWLPASH